MTKIKDLRNEVWKKAKLPSIHKSKNYYFSNKGRLKSIDKNSKKEHLMSMKPDQHGHLRASIRLEDGTNYAFWIHKHMAKAFVDKPSRKHKLIIHKNFKRDDNKLSNLKWVTVDEHKAYIQKRLKAIGYVHHGKGGNRKLNERKVATIKKMLNAGKTTKTKISKKYGVSLTQLKRIERGQNWAHVEPAK